MEYRDLKTNLYNETEYRFNVDIQILTNTITGEQSIGWTPHDSSISKMWRMELDDGEDCYE